MASADQKFVLGLVSVQDDQGIGFKLDPLYLGTSSLRAIAIRSAVAGL
ncbi:MAG: hypothetical protein JKY17_05805 [Magnetovibrio sp.]|nr:hypothetical protein [Magnetovibrio sp.]